jgi:dual specificity protein kinase YAK1
MIPNKRNMEDWFLHLAIRGRTLMLLRTISKLQSCVGRLTRLIFSCEIRQLAQHQQYTAQAAQNQRNPPQTQSNQTQEARHAPMDTTYSPARPMANSYQNLGLSSHSRTQSHMPTMTQGRVHQAQPRIPSHGHMSSSMSAGPYSNVEPQLPPLLINPPNSYYPATRNRANTINQMDAIPPALARLTHLGAADPAGARSALTPVLRRDQDIAEWEQRHAGHAKRPSMASYPGNPQLEYLQQQAESQGRYGWDNTNPYNVAYAYGMQPPPPALENNSRVSQHRTALSQDFQMMNTSGSNSLAPSSPGRYGMINTAGSNSSGSMSYLPAYPPAAASVMEAYDARGDAAMANMYTPLEPTRQNTHDRHPSQHVNSQNPFAPQHYPQAPHHDMSGHGGAVPMSPGQPPQLGDRRRSQQQANTGYGYDAHHQR